MPVAKKAVKKSHTISKEGRERIRQAQYKRWKAYHKAQKQTAAKKKAK